jgi:propanol-preferring alcohol dehydrogenase
MIAMVLKKQGEPLIKEDYPIPSPGRGQLLVKVHACGVCRTDLHVADGDLTEPKLPLIPGHEIVGTVEKCGEDTHNYRVGDRVGIPWLGRTCGTCYFCTHGSENLCDHPEFTGYTIDGGFAEYTVADERFCFQIPEGYSDVHAAPLLCAGLIGYRSYSIAGDGERIGLYGFGAAAHIIIQVAVHQGKKVYAFTRPGDKRGQSFARDLGAVWAGGSDARPPDLLDAAIIFAPVGSLVPRALRSLNKGGIVVCAGIHMSEIPSFPYRILWGERSIRSVANLTRNDGIEFMQLASRIDIRTSVNTFPLTRANESLQALRDGNVKGAAVLFTDWTEGSEG